MRRFLVWAGLFAVLVGALGLRPGINRSRVYGDTRVGAGPVVAVTGAARGDLSSTEAWLGWPHRVALSWGAETNTGGFRNPQYAESLAAFHAVIVDLSRAWTEDGSYFVNSLKEINSYLVVLGSVPFGRFTETQPNTGGSNSAGRLPRAAWNGYGQGTTPPFVRTAVAGKLWRVWTDSTVAANPYGPPRVSGFGDNGHARAALAAQVDSTFGRGSAAWFTDPVPIPYPVDGLMVDYLAVGPIEQYESGHVADFNGDGVADWDPPSTWLNADAGSAWRHWQQDYMQMVRAVFGGAPVLYNFAGNLVVDDQSYLPLMSGAFFEKFGYLAGSSSFLDAFEAARSVITSATPASNSRNVGWMTLHAVKGDNVTLNAGNFAAGVTRTRVQVARIASLLLGCCYAVNPAASGTASAPGDTNYFYAGEQRGPLHTLVKANGRTRYWREYELGTAIIVAHDSTASSPIPSNTTLDSVEWVPTSGPLSAVEPPPPVPDVTRPTISITQPTGAPIYGTSADTVTIWGLAADNESLATVSWSNSATGANGTATGGAHWTAGTIDLAMGANVFVATALDKTGNSQSASITISRSGADVTAPTISFVASVSPPGIYRPGDQVVIYVQFSEPVVGAAGSTLELELGATDRTATYYATANSIVYYTLIVAAGDETLDLDYTGTSALVGPGIEDIAGNAANLTLPSPGAAGSLGANGQIEVDGVETPPADTKNPVITNVGALSVSPGNYGVGSFPMFTVTFSEPVFIGNGNTYPTMMMELGTIDRAATYLYGSGFNSLAFLLAVQAGDRNSDLDYRGQSAFILGDRSVADAAGNPAILTLPVVGTQGSLSWNSDLNVDGVGPVVAGVFPGIPNGTYQADASISAVVQFDELVYVTGTPTLLLEMGATDRAASYASGSGTANLTFTYAPVVTGDTSTDLDYVATNSLSLAGGTIKDVLGNNATLTLASPGAAGSLAANGAIVVDTSVAPPVTIDGWNYRLAFTVKADSVSGTGTLTNVPLALLLNAATVAVHDSVFTHARSDGGDLRVTDSASNILPAEVVTYDPTAKTAEVWFRAATLSKTVTAFYLYYGNATAGSPSKPNGPPVLYPTANVTPWDEYTFVAHCEDDPATLRLSDSSPGAAHATAASEAWGDVWETADRVAGRIGNGWDYDGDGLTAINNAAVNITDHSWTVSSWVKLAGGSTDFALQAKPTFFALMYQGGGSTLNPVYSSTYCGGGDRTVYWGQSPNTAGVWYQFTWVYDNGTLLCYRNGSLRTATFTQGVPCPTEDITSCPTCPTSDQRTPVGVFGPSELCPSCNPVTLNDKLHGVADEFQLSGEVRSGAFVQTSYWNQRNPLGYYTYGVQEDLTPSVTTCASPWAPRRAIVLYNGSAMTNALRDSIAARFEFSLEGVGSDIAYMVAKAEKYQGFYVYVNIGDATDGSALDTAVGAAGKLTFAAGSSGTIDVDGADNPATPTVVEGGPLPAIPIVPGEKIPAFTYSRHLLNFGTQAVRNTLRDFVAGQVNAARSGVYPLGVMFDNAMKQSIWPITVTGTALIAEAPAGPAQVLKSPEFLTWWWDQGMKVFVQEWTAYTVSARSTVFGGRVLGTMPNVGNVPNIGGAIRIPQNPPLGHDFLNAYVAGSAFGTILEQEFGYTPGYNSQRFLPESIYGRHGSVLADGASIFLTGYTAQTDPTVWDRDLESTVASYWCSRAVEPNGVGTTPTVYLLGSNSWTPEGCGAGFPNGTATCDMFQFRQNFKGILDLDLGQPLGPPAAVADPAPTEQLRVYRRDFTCGMVLVRYNEGDTNTYTVPLGGVFFPVDVDGTLGAGVTSVSLVAGTGQVFMR